MLAFKLSPKYQKFFLNSIWSQNGNPSSGSTISFIASRHLSQPKRFVNVEVTLFILAHIPCFHLPHFVHSTEFAITLLPCLAHGSTLVLNISSFESLVITTSNSADGSHPTLSLVFAPCGDPSPLLQLLLISHSYPSPIQLPLLKLNQMPF